MPVHVIQPTFSGGEFAPALYSRVDLQKFSTGLRTCRNLLPLPYGGVVSRPGTEYVADCAGTLGARLIPFEFNESQSYVIELGNDINMRSYAKIYQNGAPITLVRAQVPLWNITAYYQPGSYVTNPGDGQVYRALMFNVHDLFPGRPESVNSWQLVTDPDPFPYSVWLPYTADELKQLKYFQSGDTLYLVCPTQPPITLVRYGQTDWRLTYFAQSKTPSDGTGVQTSRYVGTQGPFMPMNVDQLKTMSHTLELDGSGNPTGRHLIVSNFDIFQAGHVGGLFNIKNQIPTQSQEIALVHIGDISNEMPCAGTWRARSKLNQPDGFFWNGNVAIERFDFNTGQWYEVFRQHSTTDDLQQMNTYGTLPEYGLVRARNVDAIGNPTVNLEVDSYLGQATYQVTEVVNARTAVVDIVSGYSGVGPSFMWSEGSWSDQRGYPTCGGFFQDRIFFACTPFSEPQTIWFSKSSDYVDFSQNTNVTDTDAIGVALLSRKINPIKDAVPFKDVIIFLTGGAEWTLGPGQNGVLSPTSIQAKCESFRGSSKVPPLSIGNEAIFVQAMGTVVRNLSYNFTQNGYTSEELSSISNHLFRGHSVVEMAYQQEPNSVLWLLRDDGMLLSCTYMPQQQVLSWARHDTRGFVESITTIPGDGYNELWMVVNRSGSKFIERLNQPLIAAQRIKRWGLRFTFNALVSSVTGLVAFDGKPVSILIAEGTAHEQILDNQVVINGTVNLVDPITGNPINTDSVRIALAEGATQWCLDCATGLVNQNGFINVYGLDRFEGQSVMVLADGTPQGPYTVNNSQITVAGLPSTVVVGLPYVCDLETLGIELSTQEGTSQGRKTRVSAVTIRFLDSKGGLIGPDSDHLVPLNQIDANLTPYTLFSGDHLETINAEYSGNGRVFYRQADPYPVNILAVIPRISLGG